MDEPSVEQMWDYINEVLELQIGTFSPTVLTNRQWYLQVLSILFPFLSQEWNKIAVLQSEPAAIDRMMLLLAQEGAIPQQYLPEIRGSNVISGDQDTTSNLVQILFELVEQALQEGEGEEGQQQGYNQHMQQQQQEDNDGQDASYNSQERKKILRPQSPQTYNRADSEVEHPKDPHSVLGIGNEFEEDHSDSMEHHPDLNSKIDQLASNLDHYQIKNQNNGEANGYNNFEEERYNQYSTNYNSKPNNFPKGLAYDQEEPQVYLDTKVLNKYKSQPQLKDLPKKKAKKEKKLVAHPQIPKNYPKATTPSEKKLTRQIRIGISGSRKTLGKENHSLASPAGREHLQKKKRQFNYFTSKQSFKKIKPKETNSKQMTKLRKLLKWKENNLKKQQKELQQTLEIKVQLKKEAYIKKVNKLILGLERQKMIEHRREQKERQQREREQAQKRLGAIQQQYRDQLSMLHSRSSLKKTTAHTDHRSIIEGLERELKKQSEKHINNLKTRMRREEAQLDDDLQQLQRQIVRAYKRS